LFCCVSHINTKSYRCLNSLSTYSLKGRNIRHKC
jgi:hypothetical protein